VVDRQIPNMTVALEHRRFPTVTMWNRLEARPRADDFDRSLTAEIRDPLWMLTRQWQMGEFDGDDAGSPISAKIRMHTTRFTEYQPADHPVRALRDDVPLEAVVEQQPLPLQSGGRPMSLDLRLLMGRHWLRMLAKHVGDFADTYRDRYPITPPDPTDRDDAAVLAHPEAWQRVEAVATRAMDGYAFYEHLTAGGDAVDGVPVPAGQRDAVRAQATRFVEWFQELFLQPAPDDDAWIPDRLEYGFSAAAPKGGSQRRYVAEEYYRGRLDWYTVDVDPGSRDGLPGPDPQDRTLLSFLPTAVAYEGMPNSRWWTFEEGKTNFGQVTPSTTELGTLLFLEFGLVYANDWFLLPHTVPAGTIAQVEGLVVTNVFGERTWVEAAGRAGGPWAMFRVAAAGADRPPSDTSLLVLPTVPKVQEGRPIEDVALIRDEIANMVWAVETTVPLPTGEAKAGREAARETAAFHARIVDAQGPGVQPAVPQPTPRAPISYRVMSAVDEYWIPFIPVHVENNNREIQLQRAAMPRIVEGDEALPQKVEPRTGLLREGLDVQPKHPYYVHEEEVPRAGVRVCRAYQRTRWYGGRVVTWLGARKQTGRGPGSSGLVFDYLEHSPI
jgi:hypothetical protein